MNTFSTFGANYDFRFAIRCLFSKKKPGYRERLVKFLKKKYNGDVILTYKCREAIWLALSSLNLQTERDLVAICRYSCREVVDSIKNAGFYPEFLELEKDGLNFSVDSLKKACESNPKIKVVLVQNTLGFPCDIEGIVKVCRSKNLVLIEDLAHCAGGKYKNGREVGLFGDFVTFSFSQNKILDTTAGGALVTRNSKFRVQDLQLSEPNMNRQVADRIYPISSYFIKNIYFLYVIFQKIISLSKRFTRVGIGAHKMPDWYMPLIINRFKMLDSQLSHRRKIARIYAQMLDKNILSAKIVSEINQSANFRFPIFVEKKKSLILYLARHRVFLDDPWYKVPGLVLATHININEKKARKISALINKWLALGGY